MVNTMFVLDRTLNTSHILTGNKNSQSAFWEDTYTQEFDTGAESLEFSCYTHESIKEGNYVAFFYNNQYKMFQITEIEEVHKNGRLVSECYCETASLQLLNNHVRPFSGDMNCIQFFEHILNGTEWRIGKYSNSLEDKVLTINESSIESVWSLIEDYKDLFECEINTYITYENGHVTGQFIDIFSEKGLGSATYKRFEYGKNVTGITKKKDLYDWCTGIILDVECDVSNTVIEERDGYGFTKGAGDVILDDNHNRMYNAGRSHVIGVYSGKETEPVEACINAWKELEKRSVPKFDYEVTTALRDDEYDEIHLGDTVYVVDHSYTPPLLLEARVGKLELSFTDRSNNKCTLTNYKEIKSKLLDADYIKLTGTITDVVNAFFPITSEGIADGAIVDGKIETTYFQQITSDIVSAGIGAFENLYAQGLTVINADIENLRVDTAEITQLKSQLAEIDTLINGHLTSDNIQSLILTSDKVTVEDAFIKDAMIDNITANKITSGSINTDNVYISSADGSMILNGSLQQFKDKDGNVRIQIGKDAQGDFTFSLFDESGTGVLIDEKGITENAIADGLIVNDMVAENANIAGSKLDIDSVVTEINEGTTTIKGTKVVLDDTNQTLDVAFNILNTKVDDVEEEITSNTTAINVQQGQIDTLISNTTITKENGEVVQLKDEYNSTKDTVDSHTTKIGSLETTVNDVSSRQSSMELDLNGFRTEVSNTYATKGDLQETGAINDNFISNGRFVGAVVEANAVHPWVLWGESRIYTTPYTGERRLQIRMLAENMRGGIYQELTGNNRPSENTVVTLSAYVETQQNVLPVTVYFEYILEGTVVHEDGFLCAQGNNVITCTTYNGNYDTLRISFNTDGLMSGHDGSYVLFYINDVKLELGSVATGWTENTRYEDTRYTTKTEFEQTNEDFTFKLSQTGGYNLVKNSTGTGGTSLWLSQNLKEFDSYPISNTKISPSGKYFYSYNESLTTEGLAYSPRFALKPNTTYRFSIWILVQENVISADVFVLASDSLEESSSNHYSYSEIHHVIDGFNTSNNWQYVTKTFTTGDNIKSGYVRVDHNGIKNDTGSYIYVYWASLMVTEGEIELPWSPHPSEVYDGIVKIDKSGITVQHSNNKSVLDSEALKFYEGNELYSKVDGGLFKVMKPGDSSTTVGSMGRFKWVNTGTCCTCIAAGPGHDVAIGSVRTSGEAATCNLVDSSQGGYLTGTNYYYDQGLSILWATCKILNFKGDSSQPFSSQVETNVGSMSLWSTISTNAEGNNCHIGCIYGRDTLQFGIAYGPLKCAMEICESSNTSNNTSIHMYSPLNMHGYDITNAGWSNPVSASSEYTSRLLREGSIENINYGTLSYYEGEIRWCWKETVFTYAECDVDPVTDEWVYTGRNICYIELPIFMAENIQNDYHINVCKMSWGDYRIVEKNPYYFIIESQEEDFAFTFEVVAKLLDSETLANNVSIASMSTTANPSVSVEPPTTEEIILPGSENIWQSTVVVEDVEEEVIDNTQENINIGEE